LSSSFLDKPYYLQNQVLIQAEALESIIEPVALKCVLGMPDWEKNISRLFRNLDSTARRK
jgi:hypothetical protein